MLPPSLGRLERVRDLRGVWLNEATDFTPWLASEENIALLSETIEIDLEVQQQEAAVGPFRADILCRDTRTDRLVVVENQLEKTDHTHLGQLFTYAAGLDAVTVVWIAQRFTEEHRAALDWLNRITHEDFRFFGIEVELWRIGASAMAPKFNLVAKPNDWSKTVREAATATTGGMSETQTFQAEFWTGLHAIAARQESRLRLGSLASPTGRSYVGLGIGRSGFEIGATIRRTTFAKDGSVGVYLWIHGDPNGETVRRLQSEQKEIEREVGAPLNWNEKFGRKSSTIIVNYDNREPSRERWPELQAWTLEKLEAFDRAFRPRVRALGVGSAEDLLPEDGPDRPAG